MQYTKQCQLLKNKGADTEVLKTNILPGNLLTEEFDFHSDYSVQHMGESDLADLPVFADSEKTAGINSHFTYKIIKPKLQTKCDKCIILLHGLNERNWDKYIPWAAKLAELTQQAVVLFPIAFHMNRSPASWNNPRFMSSFVQQRLKNFNDDCELSFANVALSERLTLHPERFFLSGYQSAHDILKLVDLIQSGNHRLFNKNARVNFFAYSIGAMLSQVMLLAEPSRFEKSKFLLFCGGCAFEGMQGSSRFIMDRVAFNSLNTFYTGAKKEASTSMLFELINHTKLGKAFKKISMLRLSGLSKPGLFSDFNKQLCTFYLKRDTVFPNGAIKTMLRGTRLVEFDFPYSYSHVMPFPVLQNDTGRLVDQAFNDVFGRAAGFLR